MSPEVAYFDLAFRLDRGRQGYDLGQASKSNKFYVIAPRQTEPFFGIPQRVKCNEQYEKTNSLATADSNFL